MAIDIFFAGLMAMAVIKGFQRGLIVAVFSILAFIMGLAAAMKLSTVMAAYLEASLTLSSKWLPVLSFALVFIIVVVLIRFGANMLEKSVQWAMMGWINKLGGILLYAIAYTLIMSVILFYANEIHLLKPETIENSVSYGYIKPWGPKVIDGIGDVIPFFKNMFNELEQFFENVSGKLHEQ
jgi:membrane protein required for colicin V production